MHIELLRSLSGSSFHAFFDGDLAAANQARAIAWFKAQGISAITIGWNVPLDQQTGAVVDFATSSEFPDKRFAGSSLADVEAFAKLCSDSGLTVTLKPYFLNKDTAHNLSGFDSEWAAANETAVKAGMGNYLGQLGAVAQRAHADSLVIGTENSNLAQLQHKAWWEATIQAVRAQFAGLVGYAEATFPHAPSNPRDADNISFASSLDYVGVDLYAPVTLSQDPTFEEAVRGWTQNLKDYWIFKDNNAPASLDLTAFLRGLNTLYGKPVVLTETGYPANNGAGINPMSLAGAVDVAEQDLLTRAELSVLGTLGDWFGGFMLFADAGYQFGSAYEASGSALNFGSYGIVGRPVAASVAGFLAGYQHAMMGTTGNDRLLDVAGQSNVINGGAGIDTVLLPGTRAQYTITTEGGRNVVTSGAADVNVIKGVERLAFADRNVALDVGPTGSAGQTQLLLGAVLGRDVLATKELLIGSVIDLFDQGYTMAELAGALMRLDIWGLLANGGNAGATNRQIANYLLTTVNGRAPDEGTLSSATTAIDTGPQGAFLAQLAMSAANQSQVGLAGLADTGLTYLV